VTKSAVEAKTTRVRARLITLLGIFFAMITLTAAFASRAAASDGPPEIKWSPRVFVHRQDVGTVQSYQISFESDRTLAQVTLELTDKLKPYVTVSPAAFSSISASAVTEVTVAVDLSKVPTNIHLHGELFISAATSSASKAGKLRHGLPFHVRGVNNAAAGVKTTFYSGANSPTFLSFVTPQGDTISLDGVRTSNPKTSDVNTVQGTASDGSQGQVSLDQTGRPTTANLTDGTILTFNWITAHKAVVSALIEGGRYQANVTIDFEQLQGASSTVHKDYDIAGDALMRRAQSSTRAHNLVFGQSVNSVLAPNAVSSSPTGTGTGTVQVNVTSSTTGAPVSGADVELCYTGGLVSDCPALSQVAPGLYQGSFQNSPTAIPSNEFFNTCYQEVTNYQKACIALPVVAGAPTSVSALMESAGCVQIGAAASLAATPAAGVIVAAACETTFAFVTASCAVASDAKAVCLNLNAVVNLFAPGNYLFTATAEKGNLSGSASQDYSSNASLVTLNLTLQEPDCQVSSFDTAPAQPAANQGYVASVQLQCVKNVPSFVQITVSGSDGYSTSNVCTFADSCSVSVRGGAAGVVDTITEISSSSTNTTRTIQVVFPPVISTTLGLTANPGSLPATGGEVVLTATITPQAGTPPNLPAPTGTVSFVDENGTTLCSQINLSGSIARCSATISGAPDTINATYSGDSLYGKSTGQVTVTDSTQTLSDSWSGNSTWYPPAGPADVLYPISFQLQLNGDGSVIGTMCYYSCGSVTGTWSGVATSAAINLSGTVYGGPDTVTGSLSSGGAVFFGNWEIVNSGNGSASPAKFVACDGTLTSCPNPPFP
jgi:hypothetical protein